MSAEIVSADVVRLRRRGQIVTLAVIPDLSSSPSQFLVVSALPTSKAAAELGPFPNICEASVAAKRVRGDLEAAGYTVRFFADFSCVSDAA